MAILLFSCENENDVAIDFSDPIDVASGNTTIEVNNFTSFADISKGVVQRQWILPESTSILNSDGKDPSELDLIHLQFDAVGKYDVQLICEFLDPTVSLDTVFSVNVLDTITAAIEVKEIVSDYIEQTEDQIIMYENGAITFEDVSTGSPNRRTWSFPGGSPLQAGDISIEEDALVKNIIVSYQTIGVYDVELTSWRQFPDGEPSKVILKDFVKIIENIDPPTIQSIGETKEGVILLNYDFPLQHSDALTAHFTLTVNGSEAALAEVRLSELNPNTVEIIPVSKTPKDAVATLTYDGASDLRKENDVLVAAFNDQLITNYTPPNIADDTIYGFEDGGAGWTQSWQWDNLGLISFITDKAATGTYSMKMEATTDAKCRAYSRNANENELPNFQLEAGKNYTIEFKIWIDPSYTDTAITPALVSYSDWGQVGFWTSVVGLERGTWITINKELVKTISPSETGIYFMSFLFGKKGIVYIDDVKVYEVED